MAIPCPVCGSKKIEKVMGSNDIDGPGFQQWVEHEYCKNCGVMLKPNRKQQPETWPLRIQGLISKKKSL